MGGKKKSKKHLTSDESGNDSEEDYVVEKVVKKRITRGKVQYYIKWLNYSEKENTWEPIENLNCAELVEEFERNHEKPEKSKGKEKSKEKQSREKDDRSEEMEEKSANESEAMETSKSSVRDSNNEDGEKSEIGHKDHEESDENKENNDNESDESEDSIGNEGFGRGFKVEKILGASDMNGHLQFLVKWKNVGKADMIDANIANVNCPQDVIAFYQERITWDAERS